MSTQKKTLFALLAILFILLATIIYWKNFILTKIVTSNTGYTFKVHQGATFKSVTKDLHAQHVLQHPYLFFVLIKIRGVTHQLKAGEYYFPKGSTADSMINQMITGRGLVLHAFTIIAGTTFKQVRANLNNNPDLLHVTKNLSDAEIMKKLGQNELNAEGEFYPDTYFFIADSSDLNLLKRAFKAMQKKLQAAWVTHPNDLPLQNAYQALIAASLIEKEAHLDSERPIIAAVMMNRLRKNMLLQFDPTVIYGMGDNYQGTIHRSDLLNDNPYNTYRNKGLPPTPIAIPGLASINAATHPDNNDYLYFVATGDHISHHFSKTFAEHLAAVATYRH